MRANGKQSLLDLWVPIHVEEIQKTANESKNKQTNKETDEKITTSPAVFSAFFLFFRGRRGFLLIRASTLVPHELPLHACSIRHKKIQSFHNASPQFNCASLCCEGLLIRKPPLLVLGKLMPMPSLLRILLGNEIEHVLLPSLLRSRLPASTPNARMNRGLPDGRDEAPLAITC